MADEKKIKKLKRLMSLEQDPTATVFNELERIDSTIEDIKSQVDNIELKHGENGKDGSPGRDGKDGKDYTLTEEDKKAIASKIKVPVVEKVIEKTTEVIKEPTVVQNITQVVDKSTIVQDSAQKVLETIVIPEETGETIVNKINDLPTNDQALKIDAKHIKNLPTAIQQFGGVTPQKVLDLIAENPSASTFLDLTDTPDSYTGQGGKAVYVNPGETGLQFQAAVSSDEKVKYDASDAAAGYLGAKTVAGTGITLSEGTGGDADKLKITNSAPDQTVVISPGTNITSVTGTYPNFTINAATQTTDISGKADKSTTLTIDGVAQDLSANRTWTITQTGSMTFIIGDGVNTITAGTIAYLPQMPYGGTITSWYLSCVTSPTPIVGSIVLDVWKDTTGNYPPTVADTIAGSEKPTLSSQTTNSDTNLTTWTTVFNTGDCFGVKVDSVSGCRKVLLTIKFNKS